MKAALYLRVSTDEQTVENQRPAMAAWVERKGAEATEFVEEGVSGVKRGDERPALSRLLRACQRGEFDVVVVWAADRFGRNFTDSINNIEALHHWGVKFVCLENPDLDTSSLTGEVVFRVMMVFADYFRKDMLKKQAAGIERMRREGRPMGRRGQKSRPLPPAEVRDREIREALAAGRGVRAIKRELNVGSKAIYAVKRELDGAARPVIGRHLG